MPVQSRLSFGCLLTHGLPTTSALLIPLDRVKAFSVMLSLAIHQHIVGSHAAILQPDDGIVAPAKTTFDVF